MNWERFLLLFVAVFVVGFLLLAWFINAVIKGVFGPYFMNRSEEEDLCSTTNPERDYDQRV